MKEIIGIEKISIKKIQTDINIDIYIFLKNLLTINTTIIDRQISRK